MKKILLFLSFSSVCVFLFAETKNAKAVNDKCPFSGKAINLEQTAVFNACCGNWRQESRRRLKVFGGES